MSKKILKDHLHYKDEIVKNPLHPQTLWARTRIIGGYGKHTNSLGISSLDEVVFDTENMVPLIGVQYALETIFGVKGQQLTIPTLNDTMGIGSSKVDLPTENDEDAMPYIYGQKVCLFGVGTGGAADNNLTALEVHYNETSIVDMVPFRFMKDDLPAGDQQKYFGYKLEDGYHAYYLKAFDSKPIIRHMYKNGEEGEDGDLVEDNFFTSKNHIGVQSFAECCLTITRKDVREYFQAYGTIEPPRVNSIGLFTAVYDPECNDYQQIQLFSKLNIPTEPLSLAKDMNIIYRVYGA